MKVGQEIVIRERITDRYRKTHSEMERMRQKVKELIVRTMKQYVDDVERLCMEMGEEVTECVGYYGGYVLDWLTVALIRLLLAVTMPAWYPSYKYFTWAWKGAKKDEPEARGWAVLIRMAAKKKGQAAAAAGERSVPDDQRDFSSL